MPRPPRLPHHLLLAILLLPLVSPNQLAAEVSFARDVLPILSDRCFHCHGANVAEGNADTDLRLDNAESATRDRGGYAAVVPGSPETSAMIDRVTSHDDEVRMPPADSHRSPLSADEVAVLRVWITEGAVWERHWAFQRIVRPQVPTGNSHPIDAFIEQNLVATPWRIQPRAPLHTLVRRLSFDVIGLPPTWNEVTEFVNSAEQAIQLDANAGASSHYDEAVRMVVDRLLASHHYGERMAMWWLDAARYADTDGYQGDATRTNWPWRDWVVGAFQRNMPFDQFTIEQFAGDLLEDATPEQRLATCFHRNHMTNGEGGRHPEESRIDYVLDRVNTTGTVWMGLTLGCAQCHSHKFDPISQHDYYSLFAFFNQIDEDGKAGNAAVPYLNYASPFAQAAVDELEQTLDRRERFELIARELADREFIEWLPQQIELARHGFQAWHPLTASELTAAEGTTLHQESDGTVQSSGLVPFQDEYRMVATSSLDRITGVRLEVFPHASHTEGRLSRGKSGEFILTDVKLQIRSSQSNQLRDIEFSSAVADVERDVTGRNYGKIKDTLDDDPRNGWTTQDHSPRNQHVAVFSLAEPLRLTEDEQIVFVLLQRSTYGDANIGRFRVSITDQPGLATRRLEPMPMEKLAAILQGPSHHDGSELAIAIPEPPFDWIDASLRNELFLQFLEDHTLYQDAKLHRERAQRQLESARKATEPLPVMVLSDRKELRETHVLVRGVWDQHGDIVTPRVPPSILPLPAGTLAAERHNSAPRSPESQAPVAAVSDTMRSRLDLAKWLVAPEHPLTARVVVNHLWQLFFGVGLVRTPEDFGLQGEQPTHPELLDWLAVELQESGWDLQHVIRLIVTSRTYQQCSAASDALRDADPENRLYARAPRFRLPSWMLRDAALHNSGLLNDAIGGPPVFPYQPDGVWAEMFMGRFRYEPSEGASQYRRTLYTFWRRSSAPAFLFDSSMRQVCEVRRHQTNTPLQALTLLHDQTRLEAAWKLATRSLLEAATEGRITWIVQRILSRSPSQDEHVVLQREFTRARNYYREHPDDARKYLTSAIGNVADQVNHDQPELPTDDVAALMVVTSLVQNLDEALSHE